jgi:Flp pilus assembly protein CpaB
VANPTGQLDFVQPDARPRRRVVLAGRTSSTRVVFGLVLALAAAVVLGTKYEAAQKTHPVLSLRTQVQAGQVITAGNLTETRLPDTTTIPSVPAERMSQVVGQVAQAPLYPGQVLDPRAIAGATTLPAGQVAITLALAPEQAVGGSLHPGDVVAVYASAPTAAGVAPSATQVLPGVLVRSVATQSAVGGAPSVLVTLQLPATQATSLDAAYRGAKIDLALVGR